MVLVFLAQGFEEIEALATVDVLRRAGLQVVTAGRTPSVCGAHGIPVLVDLEYNDETPLVGLPQAIVLPGGLPGTENLRADAFVNRCLDGAGEDTLLCAICAAPSVLGMKGLLRGYRATCYPGYEEQLLGATVTGASVESDRNRITAKGAGVSIPFALAIVEKLVSKETADTLGDAMQCRLVTSDN